MSYQLYLLAFTVHDTNERKHYYVLETHDSKVYFSGLDKAREYIKSL